MYRVTEIFYSIQGEGYWTGRPAVFCRFSRCNLWNGKEEDRHRAICQFCDTDFTEYEEYNALALASAIKDLWPGGGHPMVVFTGGEPALQLDEKLLEHFGSDWYVAVETNGTRELQAEVDWVCVSPKTPRLRIRQGDELKLVYPQSGRMQPETYEHLDFNVFWLSPMAVTHLDIEESELMTQENHRAAFDYCLSHPQWRLNIQTHKVLGVR